MGKRARDRARAQGKSQKEVREEKAQLEANMKKAAAIAQDTFGVALDLYQAPEAADAPAELMAPMTQGASVAAVVVIAKHELDINEVHDPLVEYLLGRWLDVLENFDPEQFEKFRETLPKPDPLPSPGPPPTEPVS